MTNEPTVEENSLDASLAGPIAVDGALARDVTAAAHAVANAVAHAARRKSLCSTAASEWAEAVTEAEHCARELKKLLAWSLRLGWAAAVHRTDARGETYRPFPLRCLHHASKNKFCPLPHAPTAQTTRFPYLTPFT